MNEFETLGLSATLTRTLTEMGFEKPTQIQASTIPLLLDSKDVMGLAETGGGKTGAFLLPVLENLSKKSERALPRRPEVLVLAPTRELAGQIGNALGQFSRGLKVFHTTIFGGAPYVGQIKAMERGVHILIATPGRLMDHMKRGTVKLDNIQTLILDEADRMLDLGFKEDVIEISKTIPAIHQTVMFSATMNKGVTTFADTILDSPERVEVSKTNTVNANIDHYVLACKASDKEAVLDFIMDEGDVAKAIIFCRTKVMADKLTFDLKKKGLKIEALHGDHRQTTREKVLRKFRSGTIKFLAATDVAARGIDVRDITHVINYDMPLEPDGYVHRAGRTGRAGDLGLAFSIVSQGDMGLLRQVERIIGETIPIFKEHPFHTVLSESRGGGGRGGKPYGRGGRGGGGGGRPGGGRGGGGRGGPAHGGDAASNRYAPKNGSRRKGSTQGKGARPADGAYDPTARDTRAVDGHPSGGAAAGNKKPGNKPWKKADDGKRMDKRARKFDQGPETGNVKTGDAKRGGDKPEGRSFDKPKRKSFDKPKGKSFDKPKGNGSSKSRGKSFDKPKGEGWAKKAKPNKASGKRPPKPAAKGGPKGGFKNKPQ